MNRQQTASLIASITLVTLGIAYAVAVHWPVVADVPKRPHVPPENSATRLKVAASHIVWRTGTKSPLAKIAFRNWPTKDKGTLIDENRDAIESAHKFLRLPYYEVNTVTSIADTVDHDKELRHLALLLGLKGDVEWERGRHTSAVDYYLDAISLGRKIPNRVGVAGHFTGLVCESIGRGFLWRRVETMDSATARKCLNRLTDLESERVALSVAFEEEKYTAQSIVARNETQLGRDYTRVVPRYVVMRILSDYMGKQIALTKKPYAFGNEEMPRPKELLTDIFSPATQSIRFKYATVQTGDALLRVALALRVYRSQTGKSAANLSELVAAKLLPRVPDDPFAMPGTPLQYKVLPDGKPSLYSVGPDGVDDAGRGITTKSTKGEVTHVALMESKGDMVAGWYTY